MAVTPASYDYKGDVWHDPLPLDPGGYGTKTLQPWAHNVQPRPVPRHTQPPLPFEGLRTDAIGQETGPRALIPTDPALHQIRVANPKMNDYAFGAARDAGEWRDENQILVKHIPTNSLAGNLEWAGPKPVKSSDEPNAVQMVETHLDHRGRGIAEAMWDYAHLSRQFQGLRPVHSSNRSEQGEAFARRVGGVTPKREDGFGREHY